MDDGEKLRKIETKMANRVCERQWSTDKVEHETTERDDHGGRLSKCS